MATWQPNNLEMVNKRPCNHELVEDRMNKLARSKIFYLAYKVNAKMSIKLAT